MSYVETIGRVMHGSYEGAADEEKAAASRDVTLVCSIAAAGASIEPVPLVDLAILAPIHLGMVQAIGRVHGYKLDGKTAVEMLSTFGASVVTRSVLMSVVKIIPVFGWAASASMAYALTYAIGEVSHCYFRSGRGMSAGELRSMFRSIYESKKAEKDAGAAKNATLKQRLAQLTEAYEAGLVNDEEYRAKKEELLKAF